MSTSFEPKPTENPEQLLARFDKRIKQLTARQDEIRGWYDEYIKLEKDLTRLQGICRCSYLYSTGKLLGDGNHGGMKDHKPN